MAGAPSGVSLQLLLLLLIRCLEIRAPFEVLIDVREVESVKLGLPDDTLLAAAFRSADPGRIHSAIFDCVDAGVTIEAAEDGGGRS